MTAGDRPPGLGAAAGRRLLAGERCGQRAARHRSVGHGVATGGVVGVWACVFVFFLFLNYAQVARVVCSFLEVVGRSGSAPPNVLRSTPPTGFLQSFDGPSKEFQLVTPHA